MRVLAGASRWIEHVERWLSFVAALALAAIMLVVVADVMLRYLFAAPLFWSYDLISMYLMVTVFFFALSDTLHKHGHVAIDLFQGLLPLPVRFAGEALGYGLGTVVFCLVAWKLTERTATAFANDEVTATLIPWPLWLSHFPAALGSWVFAVRCLYRTVGHLVSAITGRVSVELPPPPITGTVEDPAS